MLSCTPVVMILTAIGLHPWAHPSQRRRGAIAAAMASILLVGQVRNVAPFALIRWSGVGRGDTTDSLLTRWPGEGLRRRLSGRRAVGTRVAD